jgi:hypothetical protein
MNTIKVGRSFPVTEKSGLGAPHTISSADKKQTRFLKICVILEIFDNGQKPEAQYF